MIAQRHRKQKLCPYNNKIPNCTKDKANNPLGVCSVWHNGTLIPQMLYKGGIFQSWKKKQTVALQKSFFETLPSLPTTTKAKADIAWFLYDLKFDKEQKQNNLVLTDTVYTEFEPALLRVTTPEPGDISNFINILQNRLDEHLDKNPPDAPSLTDIISS